MKPFYELTPSWNLQRAVVLGTLWGVVLFAGIPWWYHSTRIERRSLDTEGIQRWYKESVLEMNAHRNGQSQHEKENEIDYSRHINVAISIMHQDSSIDGKLLSWTQEGIRSMEIESFLNQFTPLHNFTIDYIEKPFAPLSYDVEQHLEAHGYVIDTDLGVFVNSNAWSLQEHSSLSPTLHLIAYIPSAKHRPMSLKSVDPKSNDTSLAMLSKNSILVPQWGGVTILNPETNNDSSQMGHALTLRNESWIHLGQVFRAQLGSLLGVSQIQDTDKSISRNSHTDEITSKAVSSWVTPKEINKLKRHRIDQLLWSAASTLKATEEIIMQQENIPVGAVVQSLIYESIHALDEGNQTYFMRKGDKTEEDDLTDVLDLFAKASELALEAFYHPSMLGSQYFPQEHTYAVYMPLFGPILLPLIATTLAEFKRYTKDRKRRKRDASQMAIDMASDKITEKGN